ncbi:MAG TPA: SpoIIE family protein phosphatase [Smithellaceae bacterium]|nr:SpoIIE family protein phosphatase [Smithellaceae bacterium]
MRNVDFHYVFRALLGAPTECGDTGIIKLDHGRCFLGLVDVLGHGGHAYEVACLAHDYLDQHFTDDLVGLMQGLHEHLRGTQGAVAAFCWLDINTGDLAYAGIGNITARILGPRAFKMVSRDGVIGYRIPSVKGQKYNFYPGDILVMHSDGVREHFNTLDCTSLLSGTAETIAKGVLEKFGKQDDDASCIAMRFLP